MALRHRGNGWQIDVSVTRDGKKVRHREQFTGSKPDAQAREWQIKADLAEGRDPTSDSEVAVGPHGETLAEAYRKTTERYWSGGRSERVNASLSSIIQEALGPHTPIRAIGVEEVDGLVGAWKANNLSNGTINRRLSSISKVMSHAVDRGALDKKPRISMLKEDTHRLRYFTPEERDVIASYWSSQGDQRWADYFTVLLDTGVRPSELEQLEARDVDLQTGFMRVWKTKTDRPRSLPLTTRSREALERRMDDGVEQLFPFVNNTMRVKKWNAIRAYLGLEDDPEFVTYACRHDCATRLLQRTGNIVLVQHWLGHTNIKMTMRYAHLVPETLMNGLNALEEQNEEDQKSLRTVTPFPSVQEKGRA